MSNKKFRPKSAIRLTLGGFVLRTSIRSGHDHLIAETVSGNWHVKWRDDTMVYRLMLGTLADDKDGTAKEYVHKWVSMVYMLAHVFPDGDFVTGFDKLLLEYSDRNRGDAPELTEEQMNEFAATAHAAAEVYNGGLDRMIEESDKELARWKEVHGEPE